MQTCFIFEHVRGGILFMYPVQCFALSMAVPLVYLLSIIPKTTAKALMCVSFLNKSIAVLLQSEIIT